MEALAWVHMNLVIFFEALEMLKLYLTSVLRMHVSQLPTVLATTKFFYENIANIFTKGNCQNLVVVEQIINILHNSTPYGIRTGKEVEKHTYLYRKIT